MSEIVEIVKQPGIEYNQGFIKRSPCQVSEIWFLFFITELILVELQ